MAPLRTSCWLGGPRGPGPVVLATASMVAPMNTVPGTANKGRTIIGDGGGGCGGRMWRPHGGTCLGHLKGPTPSHTLYAPSMINRPSEAVPAQYHREATELRRPGVFHDDIRLTCRPQASNLDISQSTRQHPNGTTPQRTEPPCKSRRAPAAVAAAAERPVRAPCGPHAARPRGANAVAPRRKSGESRACGARAAPAEPERPRTQDRQGA